MEPHNKECTAKRDASRQPLTVEELTGRRYDILHRMLKADPHYHDNFMDDPNKALEKLMFESMLVIPGLDQLDRDEPALTAESWDRMEVSPELRALNERLRELIVTEEQKRKCMQSFKERLDLEADLPSCCSCGVRCFPHFGGLEKPVSQPGVPMDNPTCGDSVASFSTFPITYPIFEGIKITEEQRNAHLATRNIRSIYSHAGVDYHLHEHLILQHPPLPPQREPHAAAAEGEEPGENDDDDNAPRVIVCSTCVKILKSGKKLPPYSIAGGNDFGRLNGMKPLSHLEQTMIAKCVCFGSIVKLKEQHSVRQRALSGQIIVFPHNGAEVAASLATHVAKTSFPFHSNEDLLKYFKVSFVGPRDQAIDHIKLLMLPNRPLYCDMENVIAWL